MHRFQSKFNVSASIRRGLAALAIGCAANAGAATIFSQNFSSELASGADPTTSYNVVPRLTTTIPLQYRVVSDPSLDFSNGYVSYTDHTGSSPSAMLFFDGVSNETIWGMNATLVAGTAYDFSFWGSSGSPSSPPVIAALLDNAMIGTPLTTTSGKWTQFSYSFVAASSGVSAFRLVDLNNDGNGNDGAIDDISLVSHDVVPPTHGVPEPGVVGLIGLGLLAAVARRKR